MAPLSTTPRGPRSWRAAARVRVGARVAGVLFLVAAGAVRGIAAPETPDGGSAILADAVVTEGILPIGRRAWEAEVAVPSGAVALGVAVSADAPVHISVRLLDATGGATDAAAPEVASRTPAAQEIVSVTPFTEVPLRAGTWRVVLENPDPSRALAFEVVAFVDGSESVRAVLPGRPIATTLPAGGGTVTLRTWLPKRATNFSVDLTARDERGVRFALEGPDGYARQGPGLPRLLVEKQEAPPGAYRIALAAPAEADTPRRVTAEAAWDFGSGRRMPVEAEPLLVQGTPLTFVLGGEGNALQRDVRVSIPDGAAGFVLSARTEPGSDVDVFVRREGPVAHGVADADWLAVNVNRGSERLAVGGALPLPAGVYHAQVMLVDDAAAVEVTLHVRRSGVPSPTWGEQEPPLLPSGVWVAGTVRSSESAVHWHAIEVPVGATSVHAMVLEATAPLDLVLARRSDGSLLGRSFSTRVGERLDVVFQAPLPTARRFLLGVVSRSIGPLVATYRIAALYDRPPPLPEGMAWPPLLDATALSPMERVAAATVEVTTTCCIGGSGTCVTPGGLIVTCRHVLLDSEGPDARVQRGGILIAFPRRMDVPPVQSFVARAVAEDAERDLVLLEIVEDVFGRPPPADLALPWVPLGDSTALRLGDPVVAFGYPEEGSPNARTAIVVTRGTVAGFERSPEPHRWIKTDAWIAPGHSGGAIVDAQGRLVGIPAATLGRTESIGLAIPIEVLPEAWRTRIERALKGP